MPISGWVLWLDSLQAFLRMGDTGRDLARASLGAQGYSAAEGLFAGWHSRGTPRTPCRLQGLQGPGFWGPGQQARERERRRGGEEVRSMVDLKTYQPQTEGGESAPSVPNLEEFERDTLNEYDHMTAE